MSSPSVSHDFAIVGGGIVAACLADELATTGASVVVFDAGATAGSATQRAAGVAVPSLRYLGDQEFYQWLCAASEYLASDIARLEQETDQFAMARPILRALRQTDAEQHAASLADVDGRWVEHADLGEIAPGLNLPKSRQYILSDGLMVDGAGYLGAVRDHAVAQGVTWLQGTEVHELNEDLSGVSVTTGRGVFRSERAVVAAGAWSSFLGAPAVTPQRGQMILLRTEVELPVIFSSALYLAPAIGGGVLVGATEETVGFDAKVTAGGISGLLSFATAAMPALASAEPVELRAGLRPTTASGRPIVGAIPNRSRLFVCAGHAGHGLLSARATAMGLVSGLTEDDWDSLPYSMCPSKITAESAR
ncbi:FAD-dependent oxidoreductase [Rhodococcus sp. 06-235-1A]|uniref:NAD(P)/FAD-dependent oxidoreductase n=1 Tax=Rhodococcus sp. 06-235-1A TaxID=2022508 RepID=UPI000B9C6E1A|nr:FAD-dependent oxidoreductase [Rhodococcus sp. 06-235-1A]OZD06458.1 FAD-dependent oxidoreductase [Rhodococcus sp. 06-235-1A]